MRNILICVSLMQGAFFILVWFIRWYLPDYSGVINYLCIVTPGIVISSCVTLISFAYCITMGYTGVFLVFSIAMVFVGFLLNTVSYHIVPKAESYSVASIITLIIWFVISEEFLKKKLSITWKTTAIKENKTE